MTDLLIKTDDITVNYGWVKLDKKVALKIDLSFYQGAEIWSKNRSKIAATILTSNAVWQMFGNTTMSYCSTAQPVEKFSWAVGKTRIKSISKPSLEYKTIAIWSRLIKPFRQTNTLANIQEQTFTPNAYSSQVKSVNFQINIGQSWKNIRWLGMQIRCFK